MSRLPTSVRLSSEGMALWSALARELGLSRAAVLEQAIRLLAKAQGIASPREE